KSQRRRNQIRAREKNRRSGLGPENSRIRRPRSAQFLVPRHSALAALVMSSVSETIVREYFELHEFLVRQHRKYIAQTKREEDDIDFFVLNPRAQKREGELPFVLSSGDLPTIERAIVAVKGWHTETFSSARITSTPELFRFVGTKVFQQAARVFGESASTLKILVIPTLPQAEQGRAESIALLRAKGIDAVIPFSTILADLI